MITSPTKKNVRTRHIPQRTCVGCREIKPKRELIRIIRSTSGTVEVDITGKKSGRGVYLCKTKDCWEPALKGKHLDHALKIKIPAQNRKELAHYAEMLPSKMRETK
jgi:hypothetical protein